MDLPLFQQLEDYEGQEVVNLLQLRIMCFAQSTWCSMVRGLKPYLNFCLARKVKPYPVNISHLNLCSLQLAQEGKSSQVIEHFINSVLFASNFLGSSISKSEKSIKNTLKFISKHNQK